MSGVTHRALGALFALFALSSSAIAAAPQPATIRLDYIHSGNASSEQYAIERVLVEPAGRYEET